MVAGMVLAAEAGEVATVREKLASDPAMLSSFFQNVDLLYAGDYVHADALAMLTLEALHEAVEREGASLDDL